MSSIMSFNLTPDYNMNGLAHLDIQQFKETSPEKSHTCMQQDQK